MTQVWVAEVPRPRCVPIEQVHVMLYSYFPAYGYGAGRPYVWRLLDPERIGMISAARPAANTARLVTVTAGTTLAFRLTYKRVRATGGSGTRPDGRKRERQRRYVPLTSMPEMRERLIRFAGERGGAIGYVRLDRMRELQLEDDKREIRVPIVDAEGHVVVTDPVRFAELLAGGGPGTGKAFGCGAWWIPELMGTAA